MKNLRLKKLNVVQTANALALLYAPIGLLYLLIGGGLYLAGDSVGGITFAVMGGLLPLLGWAMVALMIWLLNLAFKITGGITFQFEEEAILE